MDTFDSTILPPDGSRLLSESPQFSLASASSGSHTGPGGSDLSLSELYLDNRLPERHSQARDNQKTRPSIAQALGFVAPLDQSDDRSGALEALEEGGEEEEGDVQGWEGDNDEDSIVSADMTVRVEDADRTRLVAQSREEKLQSDLFVLRQMNSAFAAYSDALRATQAGTEVSARMASVCMRLYVPFFFLFVFIRWRQRIAQQLEQTDALLNKYINILSKSEQVTRLIFDERWMGAEAVCTTSLLSP
jgi:DASH complex subunit Duo1